MKLNSLLSAAFGLFAVSSLFGVTVPSFSDDFESGLSKWTGKSGGAHHGVIVADPLDASNNVLSFTSINSAGDIFSIDTVAAATSYVLSFDYMGAAGSPSGSGFMGLSTTTNPTSSANHNWLAGVSYPGLVFNLIDDGTWRTYQAVIASPFPGSAVHLMIEDFRTPAMNAYFDNFSLRDASAVPDGGTTVALFGFACLGLIGLRRKFTA